MGKEVSMAAEAAAEKSPEMDVPKQVSNYEFMIEKQRQVEDEIKTLLEDFDHNQGYGKDSMVTIPGQLFSLLSNFFVQSTANIRKIQSINNQTAEVLEGIVTANAEFNLDFLKIHKENMNKGITIPLEALEKEQAKSEIGEPKKEASIKKKGSKVK